MAKIITLAEKGHQGNPPSKRRYRIENGNGYVSHANGRPIRFITTMSARRYAEANRLSLED